MKENEMDEHVICVGVGEDKSVVFWCVKIEETDYLEGAGLLLVEICKCS
jgi:hypothetical protein